ncbi:MAG: carboxylate-amine ligase [Chloroflexota bacterium]
MSNQSEHFTLGVEEEYQITDPTTRSLVSRSMQVLPNAQETLGESVQTELQLAQIEIATPVCQTLAEVRQAVVESRRKVIEAAATTGHSITAAGTHPFAHWDEQEVTPKKRYQELLQDYQQLAREQIICGCHVHVGLRDCEAAIPVMNRARVWLTPLLALAANSPFWLGVDTGYASFRTQIWVRWPIAGPPQVFTSRAEYDALVQALVTTGCVEDDTKLYWDIRLPSRIDTIEFRVTDVCATVDEAVMIAGLARALVRTCYEQAIRDESFSAARPELLRAAHWRAARYGLEDKLIDINKEQAIPAHDFIRSFLEFVGPALQANGDLHEVSDLVNETLQRGNGAMRQREVYQRTNNLVDVVDFVVAETRAGI